MRRMPLLKKDIVTAIPYVRLRPQTNSVQIELLSQEQSDLAFRSKGVYFQKQEQKRLLTDLNLATTISQRAQSVQLLHLTNQLKSTIEITHNEMVFRDRSSLAKKKKIAIPIPAQISSEQQAFLTLAELPTPKKKY